MKKSDPVFSVSPYRDILKAYRQSELIEKMIAATRVPSDYIFGAPMANFGNLDGVEYVEGVYITKWPLGRLYWPVEALPQRQTKAFVGVAENILNWTAGLTLQEGKSEHYTFERHWGRIGFCKVKNVEEPWKKWAHRVGNVDPDEWVVTFIALT